MTKSTIKKYSQQYRCHVIECRHCEEVLASASERSWLPDYCICDCQSIEKAAPAVSKPKAKVRFHEKPKRYKLRAECFADIVRFMNKLRGEESVDVLSVNPVDGAESYPERELLFTSRLRISTLRAILLDVDDCHVMFETLELENNYTGIRDYSTEKK